MPPAAAPKALPHSELEKNRKARRIQGNYCDGELEKQIRKEENPKRYAKNADRIFDGRDSHNVLRERDGRFKKETTPKHKRPVRIPWDKK